MKIQSIMRNVRIAPTKVRHLADLVRGKTIEDSLDSLRFLPHRGARLLEKVINSAKANAEDRGVRGVGELMIEVANVDSGSTLKRMQPHARGVGFAIKKRTSHIKIVLDVPTTN